MFHHILVAYDGSAGAKRAFAVALELAVHTQATLSALAVEEQLPHFAATISETNAEKELANHLYQQCLSAAYLQALQAGITLQCDIRVGHAAQVIITVAQEQQCDLLVLGRSGHSHVWGRFLGTTAEKVSRHVSCAVLLVP